eukprot:scaffold1211_cov195-Alexandrium_tamarense.AAC.35
MGQAASKAASAVKQSTSGVVVSNHGPKARAAAGVVVGGGGHDASAVDHGRTRAPGGEYSPTRGAGLEVNTGEMMPEMPPDLIKFLTNAGPLKRSIDKERTSPKVYDSLVVEDDSKAGDTAVDGAGGGSSGNNEESTTINANEEKEQMKQANLRVRRRMPIMGGGGGEDSINKDTASVKSGGKEDNTLLQQQQQQLHQTNNESDDGTMTTRTTNFSTTDRSHIYMGFGLGRRDLFEVSKKLSTLQQYGTVGVGGESLDQSKEWKELVKNEFHSLIAKDVDLPQSSMAGRTEEQLDQDLKLMEDSLRYIGVPVLMKDTDGDIIGTWGYKVNDLRFSGLGVAKEGSVEFVLLGEERRKVVNVTEEHRQFFRGVSS